MLSSLLALGTVQVLGQTVIDPKSTYEALAGLGSSKSEFETTIEYQQRLAALLNRTLAPSISLQSPLPFLLNGISTGVSLPVTKFSYDADSELLTIALSPKLVGNREVMVLKTEVSELGRYTGQNAFGATTEVTSIHAEEYGIEFEQNEWLKSSDLRLPLPKDQARLLFSQLRLVLVCKAISPYVTTRFTSSNPTLDAPTDYTAKANLIVVEPLELRLYDGQSGQLLKIFTASSVVAEHRQTFPIHLEVERSYFTENNLLYQVDDEPMLSTPIFRGRPFLVLEAKSQIKVAGMDKMGSSKLTFRLNGQVIQPTWFSEKYAFLGTTFGKYAAIVRLQP